MFARGYLDFTSSWKTRRSMRVVSFSWTGLHHYAIFNIALSFSYKSFSFQFFLFSHGGLQVFVLLEVLTIFHLLKPCTKMETQGNCKLLNWKVALDTNGVFGDGHHIVHQRFNLSNLTGIAIIIIFFIFWVK